MELSKFKSILEEQIGRLTYLGETIYSKFVIEPKEDEIEKAEESYAPYSFDSFYNKALDKLCHLKAVTRAIYVYTVCRSEDEELKEAVTFGNDLQDHLDTMSECIFDINAHLFNSYAKLTGHACDRDENKNTKDHIDGFTNYIIDEMSCGISIANAILDFLEPATKVESECCDSCKSCR